MRTALRETQIPFAFHHVADGREAMDFLSRKTPYEAAPRPDFVLLDLNMPRMDGREVLHAIKSDPDLRAIPVIVLTTSSVERDVEASYLAGAAGYAVKPIDVDKFFALIQEIEIYWKTMRRWPANED
ncbi:Two-component system response regulator [Paramagnetospirillum magnetotacticum MS-1]|uniref:Two-component system response regulator n=1 Tax=Paramagnetospirillum magnetotacticum MS-1 TaxID=272627 RepID=A0A0C2UBX0_PARME|nr:Two-component system response regulator [Paramagnetospirillum magnetotacticum MS-1]